MRAHGAIDARDRWMRARIDARDRWIDRSDTRTDARERTSVVCAHRRSHRQTTTRARLGGAIRATRRRTRQGFIYFTHRDSRDRDRIASR
jgi:hypothetical protein